MANRFLRGGGNICNKGQGILEACFVFISATLLIGAVLHLWVWANNQVVRRQIYYNAGRVAAGQSTDTYKLKDHWPVYAPDMLDDGYVLIDAPKLGGG